MPRGRPPKLLAHPNIAASSPVAGAPSCPKDLSAEAKRKWKSTVKLMTDAGLISRLDVDLLAMYCEAWARRQDAMRQLGGVYVLDGDKGKYQNPILHVANKAMDQMIRVSKLLGLDSLTRKKLGVSTKPATVQSAPVRDRFKTPKNVTG